MYKTPKEIVQEMTLQEKARFCSGADFWHLCGCERLGVPQTMVSDGPHGLRKQDEAADHLGIQKSIRAICFPAACATAASFDETLLEEMGSALGQECRAEGVSTLLGPAVNIKRSPLCGRNFEYFSEDPYLAGRLSAAMIRGVQKWGVGTSIKHFAANNQEYRRQSCSSEVDERTLREIYLRAFEIAVKTAKPWTVMCSYNKINGTYASENKKLLTDILRTEWGFDGYVMSDWGAVVDRVKALTAGLDLEMPGSGGETAKQILEAVKTGKLLPETLDRAVERILNVVFRWTDADVPDAVWDHAAHHQLAVYIEKECAVLLKNEGALPLSSQENVVFIGAFAKAPRYQGGGSSHINAPFVSNAFDTAMLNGRRVQYAKGFAGDSDALDESLINEAVEKARLADKAVIFAGLPDIFESEGYDREHMRLPACQNTLIRRVCAVQKNTVVVLHNGSPVEMPWYKEVNAILEMYLGGQGVGEAAEALLYGDANPCGRLPESFPLKLADNPSYLYFPGDKANVRYAEGIYVGYRYYDTKKMPVLFPFGHGLSYTTFAYGKPALSSVLLEEGKSITVSVSVQNTGSRFGKEVVQLYVRDCTGTVSRPDKELKGFHKVALQPGESKTVTFTVDSVSLAYYDTDLHDWYAAGGDYELLIASSSRHVDSAVRIQYASRRKPYLKIDRQTTFGELLLDARTRPFMQAKLKELAGTSKAITGDAFSGDALQKLAANVPLTFLKNLTHISDAQLDALVEQLRALL